MKKEEVLEILRETEAMLEGHFLLTSGRHSDKYIQCAKVFQYPEYAEMFSKQLAEAFKGDDIDVVVGPAMGGIVFAYEVGRQLGVRAIFAERENGIMTLRRGFYIKEGENVLVVEDVTTTGGSVKEVIEVVRNCGGNVVGVGSLVDRSNGTVDFGVKFVPIVTLDVKSYEPQECPLCKQGINLVKPGSRNLA
ncbi:orotate phosphoribosyltransferase [Caldanaerobius fijiensis DSM 17918]|uniref:Orotate phosphoribosyltransferase n=1 Tax=Caldanaerobius fijiensis DSM 17918 TaxID=1121256 RepID=A0A1M4TTV2_9THEO|nr:orotate phosphoribosyltransferase [Caldanaerobius fijiensis]SHE47737.1 orotate phosphoribosyltransferase [Caldanaerobius fijiensis DSM 17918]